MEVRGETDSKKHSKCSVVLMLKFFCISKITLITFHTSLSNPQNVFDGFPTFSCRYRFDGVSESLINHPGFVCPGYRPILYSHRCVWFWVWRIRSVTGHKRDNSNSVTSRINILSVWFQSSDYHGIYHTRTFVYWYGIYELNNRIDSVIITVRSRIWVPRPNSMSKLFLCLQYITGEILSIRMSMKENGMTLFPVILDVIFLYCDYSVAF